MTRRQLDTKRAVQSARWEHVLDRDGEESLLLTFEREDIKALPALIVEYELLCENTGGCQHKKGGE